MPKTVFVDPIKEAMAERTAKHDSSSNRMGSTLYPINQSDPSGTEDDDDLLEFQLPGHVAGSAGALPKHNLDQLLELGNNPNNQAQQQQAKGIASKESKAAPFQAKAGFRLVSFPTYVTKKEDKVSERTEQRIKEFLDGLIPWKRRCCRICDLAKAKQIEAISDTLHQDIMLFHEKEKHQQEKQLIAWKKGDDKFELKLLNGTSVTLCKKGLQKIFGLSIKTVPNKPSQNKEGQRLTTSSAATREGRAATAGAGQRDRPGTDTEHVHHRSGPEALQETRDESTTVRMNTQEPEFADAKLNDGPYQNGFNVEEDEKACQPLFEELKLLLGGSHGGKNHAEEKVRKMGKIHADIMYSKRLWEDEWLKKLEPTDLLLLCLNSSMFCKADLLILKKIIKVLQLEGTVKRAVVEWNLQESYPTDTGSLVQQPAKVLKSVAFISRVFHALREVWNKKIPEGDLMKVVHKSLKILEEAAKREQEKKSKKRKSLPVCYEGSRGRPTPSKKKRSGHPRKGNGAANPPGSKNAQALGQHERRIQQRIGSLKSQCTTDPEEKEDSKLPARPANGINQNVSPCATCVVVAPHAAPNGLSKHSHVCAGEVGSRKVRVTQTSHKTTNAGGPLFGEPMSPPGQATQSDVASVPADSSDAIYSNRTDFQATRFGPAIAKLKAKRIKEDERFTAATSELDKRRREDINEAIVRINERYTDDISEQNNRHQETVNQINVDLDMFKKLEHEDETYKKQLKADAEEHMDQMFDSWRQMWKGK